MKHLNMCPICVPLKREGYCFYTKRLTLTSVPGTQIDIAPIIGGVLAFIVAVVFVAVVVVILLLLVRSRLGLLLTTVYCLKIQHIFFQF